MWHTSKVKAAMLAGAVVGVMSLVAACDRPDTTPLAPSEDRRTQGGSDASIQSGELNVYGPDSISQNGTYRFTAQLFLPYASFQWWNRFCDVLDVGSCSNTWIQVFPVVDNQWTTHHDHFLALDCSGEGTRSYQIKVTASAFGNPPQTKYKVTKLCGPLP